MYVVSMVSRGESKMIAVLHSYQSGQERTVKIEVLHCREPGFSDTNNPYNKYCAKYWPNDSPKTISIFLSYI